MNLGCILEKNTTVPAVLSSCPVPDALSNWLVMAVLAVMGCPFLAVKWKLWNPLPYFARFSKIYCFHKKRNSVEFSLIPRNFAFSRKWEMAFSFQTYSKEYENKHGIALHIGASSGLY